MDIQLLQNFKQLINKQYDEMIISQLEQYKCEVEQLHEQLESVTSLIKEKEELIEDLKTQLEDNRFEESNFNNVSIIQNLNKQIHELTHKNLLLSTSLKHRKKSINKNEEENVVIAIDSTAEEEVNTVVVQEEAVEEEAVEEEAQEEVVQEEVVQEEEAQEEEAVPEVVTEEEEAVPEAATEEEEEEEVEVTEIEYKGKVYYVQDDIMYNKKKNGDMGKEVGKLVNGKPKLNKKKKKDS